MEEKARGRADSDWKGVPRPPSTIARENRTGLTDVAGTGLWPLRALTGTIAGGTLELYRTKLTDSQF